MTAVAAPPPARLLSRPVLAWTAWDWGSASFNAVITTFVFTVYLTGDAFTGLQEGDPGFAAAKAGLSSGLGWGIAVAGVVVALLAPVLGKRADATGRRRVPMAIATGVVVASMFGMFAITPVPGAFWAGVALVGLGTVAYEIGAVNYNSMLLSISTPRSIGRVSAFGWAAGYVGGIVLLVVLYATLIPGGPELLGDLRADGLGIRLCAVVCAVWFLVFGLPVLLTVRDEPGRGAAPNGVLATYRQLFRDIAELGRQDRNLLFFLIASAVFRDGLTGVFTFGAVIASTVFGFTFGQVLIFAVAANLVAGVSTLVSGRFDDRFGPKPVILVSLVGLVVTGTGVFLARDGGTAAFWVGGLLLCLFVGPAQTSSRSLLGRLSPPERAGELFGLYATTGRAASFIAPAAFAVLTTVAQDQGFGILGIVLVLAVGLVLMLPVRGAGSPAEGAGRALEGSDHP
ncbi:MFS transporter [Amnibacterium setariae]|uniref:MFS transporter n=1 Tax=Amnibacterium setariae TaxID=2306585 RepID=A0A3A1U4K2_9MICO|nr:MFS transporter [Amnibacterium setariae]RIX31303.1 MFS transporter [Amnibacterium setariae]